MTVRASKKAVPFMLMVAPRGNTKRATGSLMPCSVAHRSVTGSVAMLESVPKTVTRACANALQFGQHVLLLTGFRCKAKQTAVEHLCHAAFGVVSVIVGQQLLHRDWCFQHHSTAAPVTQSYHVLSITATQQLLCRFYCL